MDTQQQKSCKILLIGDRCIDVYHYGDCSRLSPEAPVPVFRLLETIRKPGMVLNVEKNLEALGNETHTVTCGSTCITKERYIDAKSKNQLLRVDIGENDISESVELSHVDISDYDSVVVSDYNKGSMKSDNCLKLSHDCIEAGKPLFVDSKKTDLSCYPGAFFKINEKESKNVLQYPADYDIIVTLGSKGAKWENQIIKAPTTEVFDACGAGDTFFAAFVSEYMQTKNVINSIHFANQCAALTVRKIGAYSPTQEEIQKIKREL